MFAASPAQSATNMADLNNPQALATSKTNAVQYTNVLKRLRVDHDSVTVQDIAEAESFRIKAETALCINAFPNNNEIIEAIQQLQNVLQQNHTTVQQNLATTNQQLNRIEREVVFARTVPPSQFIILSCHPDRLYNQILIHLQYFLRHSNNLAT